LSYGRRKLLSDQRKRSNPTPDNLPGSAAEHLIRRVPPGQECATIAELPALRASWLLHLRAKNLSPRTIQSYGEAAQRLSEFLESQGWSQSAASISRRHLEAFVADQLDRHSAATAANRYRSLKQLFRWLEDEREISDSPMRTMRAPAVPEQSIPVVPIGTLRRLLATCGSRSLVDVRDKAVLMVFIDTGARLSEVTGLQLYDVDLTARVLYVMGKGSRPRVLPVGDRTVVALDRYLRKRAATNHKDRAALWVGAKGEMTPSGVAQIIKRRCRQAGVPNIHPHQFRLPLPASGLPMAAPKVTSCVLRAGVHVIC
jgi:site-specific recombinase XerD